LSGSKNKNGGSALAANSPFLAAATAATTTSGGSSSDLNPRNLMPDDIATRVDPSDPNALALPTQRQISSIPKTPEGAASPPSSAPSPVGCTSEAESTPLSSVDPHMKDGRWVYPSQQQFYQAMKRKNHQPDPNQMAVIVPLHNAINEQAWAKILQWEQKYKQ
jgi:cytochrome c heme-lyase